MAIYLLDASESLRLVSGLFSFYKKEYVKVDGISGAVRRTPVMVEETSWAKTYQKRMRRFNLEVVVLALGTLPILIAWIFVAWWAFSK